MSYLGIQKCVFKRFNYYVTVTDYYLIFLCGNDKQSLRSDSRLVTNYNQYI